MGLQMFFNAFSIRFPTLEQISFGVHLLRFGVPLQLKIDDTSVPKPLKCLWVNPSKHMVFTVWERHWATSDVIGNLFLFRLLVRRLLCYVLFVRSRLGSHQAYTRPVYVCMCALNLSWASMGHRGLFLTID